MGEGLLAGLYAVVLATGLLGGLVLLAPGDVHGGAVVVGAATAAVLLGVQSGRTASRAGER